MSSLPSPFDVSGTLGIIKLMAESKGINCPLSELRGRTPTIPGRSHPQVGESPLLLASSAPHSPIPIEVVIEDGSLEHEPADSDKDDESEAPAAEDKDCCEQDKDCCGFGGYCTAQRQEFTWVLIGGALLAFNSGWINGCCLSGHMAAGAPKQSVAGFTGAYTNAGLELADGDSENFRFHISMILSFIAGSFLTGLINPHGKPYELTPEYGPTFLIGASLLIAASILAANEPASKSYYYLAAAANGLQNGMSSVYSGNLLRTCHLTGTSTDIGLFLAQIVRGIRNNEWKLYVLLLLAFSFLLGSFISFFAIREWESETLIFNAVLFLAIGISCIVYFMVHYRINVWQAATGTWHWQVALAALQHHPSLRMSRSSSEGEGEGSQFLLEIFDVLDEDKSGFIDEDELKRALEEAGTNISQSAIIAMIKVADADGDGRISREEWGHLIDKCFRLMGDEFPAVVSPNVPQGIIPPTPTRLEVAHKQPDFLTTFLSGDAKLQPLSPRGRNRLPPELTDLNEPKSPASLQGHQRRHSFS